MAVTCSIQYIVCMSEFLRIFIIGLLAHFFCEMFAVINVSIVAFGLYSVFLFSVALCEQLVSFTPTKKTWNILFFTNELGISSTVS